MFGTSKQTWWKPSPLLARKRATPVVSSVGSTSSILDSPTPRKAIRTRSYGMSMTVSSSSPSASRQSPSEASIELTMSATWWTLPMRRIVSGTRRRRRATCAQRTLSAMPAEGPESGIVVRVTRARRRSSGSGSDGTGPPAVGRARPRHDPVPVRRPGRPRRRPSARTSRRSRPRTSRSTSDSREVGRFPTVVYLAPEPSEPFDRLTEAIDARFPDFPPYAGAFDGVIPHLTITESAAAPLDDIEPRRPPPSRSPVG